MMHKMRRQGWKWALGIVPLVALAVAAVAWLVMTLWNGLFPDLFGWHAITFMQALGLLILSKILFGGWHRGGHRWHHHGGHGAWGNMTDEERERIREKFRGRCWHHDEPEQKPHDHV